MVRVTLPRFLIGLLLSLAAAIGIAAWVVRTAQDEFNPHQDRAFMGDLNRARMIAEVVRARGPDLPSIKGDRIDLYAILREGVPESPQQNIPELCWSSRTNAGPDMRQIEGGDYSKFPYVLGTSAGSRNRPILWDKLGYGRAGWRIVVFADGTARVLTQSEFDELGVGETSR
ncbi:MAG: hypothetical protein AAGD14_02010 [Planctomycetota bacterium]